MAFERVFPGGSKTLFLATTNPGKLTEILKLYAGLDIEFKSPKDFPGLTAPEETGETFKENAALKEISVYFSLVEKRCFRQKFRRYDLIFRNRTFGILARI